jgi:hypothetical protein
MKYNKPTKAKLPVVTQLCKFIPSHLVSKLARKHGIYKQARSFTAWSHVVSLLFAQLTHFIGLNDVCDTLRIHSRWLGSLRGAVGELYQARWGIDVFFKQIMQTLQVCDFLGHSKHAIRWQLWAALLLYILMRF